MQCSCKFNETSKTITVSSDTQCEWSCFVNRGNITLSQYYGELSANGETELTIFTYNTYDIYGRVIFRFKSQTENIEKICSFSSSAVQVLYANTYSVNLFGNGTKNYIYIYYRFIDNAEQKMLSQLTFTINGDSFTYSGKCTYYTIQDGLVDLYNIILGDYNENGYFEIGIYSLNNYQFKDIINISDTLAKIQIVLEQYEVVNRPTLLKISPTRVFLSSIYPKQKINVSSIYNGQNTGYYIYTIDEFILNAKRQQNVTKNAVEEYLNNRSNAITTTDNDNWKPLGEKNASHFVLNVEGAESSLDNVDGNKKTAYQLFVVNAQDENQYQKLEFFYDHIIDPQNLIQIASVQNVYAYVDSNKNKTDATNGSINFESGQTSVTLYFTKEASTPSNAMTDCIYAQYNEKNNIIFTINSTPNWWRILEQSDYVKEVKQDNKLILSLEEEIPTSENTYVKLQGELGATCVIYVKNEEGIINRNKQYFGFTDELLHNINVDFSAQTTTLVSYSSKENLYYKDETYTILPNTSGLTIPTLHYTMQSGTNEVKMSVSSGDTYTIYYDQTINKKYIIYGSKTYIESKQQYEIKDTNKYYFESNKITLPIPVLTSYTPWTIINNGSGVNFDAYVWKNEWINITKNSPTYFPQNSSTTLYIDTIRPDSGQINTVYLITKNNIDYATVSTILFQQSNSLDNANLYINFQTKEQTSTQLCVHKYGVMPNITKMTDISFSSLTESIGADSGHSGVVTTTLSENKWTNLYYASYVKSNINVFQVENQDIDVYLPHEVTSNLIDIDFHNNVISSTMDGYELYVLSYDKLLTNDNKDIFWDLSGLVKINDWTISGGTINYMSNGTRYTIFPQINIFKTNKGYVFLRNQRNYNNNYVYYGLKTPIQTEYGSLIKIDKKNDIQITTIDVPCLFVPKSVLWQQQRYVLEDNIFINSLDKKEYKCYQGNDGKYYINIPSMNFPISSTSLTIQNDTLTMDSGGCISYNDIDYYVDIKIVIPQGTPLQLMRNVEGYNNDNTIDAFLIVNNNKISCEEDKMLYINHQPIFSADDEYNYAITLKDCEINAIKEGGYEYIVINNEEHKLVNNELIYDSVVYQKQYLNLNGENVGAIILSNKGYQIKKRKPKYYCSINNKKYFINPQTDKHINGEQYYIDDSNKPKFYCVQELINETFNLNIDINQNLYNSPLINGTYTQNNVDYTITNGYIVFEHSSILNVPNNSIENEQVKIDGNVISEMVIISTSDDYYFYDPYYPILKEQYIEENVYPYKISSVEYISIPLINMKNITPQLKLVSLTFSDETEVINVNDNKYSFSANANSTHSVNIREEKNIITINDYSVITFNDNVLIKFNNDCVILFEKQQYSFKKNEYLYIPEGKEVTFTDITTIMFVNSDIIKLYAFTDVAVEYEEDTTTIQHIYYTTIVNDQEAIIDNDNNIVYVYNNKAYIQKKEITVYDRYVFMKQLTDSGLVISFGTEVINTEKEGNDLIYYGCNEIKGMVTITGEDIKNIKWAITLPYYDDKKEKLMLNSHPLTNMVKINDNNNNYNQITINNYSPTTINTASNLIVENGDIVLKIDLYKIVPKVTDEANNSESLIYYTNSLMDYMITLPSTVSDGWIVDDKNHNLTLGGEGVSANTETHILHIPLALNTDICIWDSYSNTYWKEIPIKNSQFKQWNLKKQITINNIVLNVDENNYVQVDKNTFCKIYGIRYQYVDYTAKKITIYVFNSAYEIKSYTASITSRMILEPNTAWDKDAINHNLNKKIFKLQKYTIHIENPSWGPWAINSEELNSLYPKKTNTDSTKSCWEVKFLNTTYTTQYDYEKQIDAQTELVELLMRDHYKIYEFVNFRGVQYPVYEDERIQVYKHNYYILNEEPIPMAIVDVNYENKLQNDEYFIRYKNDSSGFKKYEIKNGTVTVPRTFNFYEVNNKSYILFDIYAKLFTKFSIKLLNSNINGIRTIQVKNDAQTSISRQLVLQTKNCNTHQDFYGKYFLTSSLKWAEDSNFKGFNPYNGWDFVDLGLPSGLKWAKLNVGAGNETEVGWFFAWADPKGYTTEGYTPLHEYTKSNVDNGVDFQKKKDVTETAKLFQNNDYVWGDGNNKEDNLCKYVVNSSMAFDKNFKDNKIIIELTDDGVRAHMGGSWRMPTKTEMQELTTNTNFEWTTIDGVDGAKFTNKSDSSKYIFLPKGFRCFNNTTTNDLAYWTSTMNTDNKFNCDAWYLHNNNKKIEITHGSSKHGRPCGYPLRGVIQ